MKNSNAKASKSHLGQIWDNDTEWMLSTHKSESDVTYSQVWWPILGIHALHLPIQVHTHSSEHTPTPGAVGSYGARGAVGGSVPCSREPHRGIEGGESAAHSIPQSLPDQDSNSQPFNYESDSLLLGHDFPH